MRVRSIPTPAAMNLRSHEFYAERLRPDGAPEPWTLEDLEDFASAHDDPYAGRVAPGNRPAVSLQLEATSEPPVWIGLSRRELSAWADGVARIWRRLDLRAGDAIAFFDYGSNPFVLLSSSMYVPHLRRGAATGLGAHAICNDGVASMTERMVGILESVSPAAILVRRDLVAPLCDLLAARGIPPGSRLRWAVVGETEGAPAEAEVERLASALGVPVRRTLRADAALFSAADCKRCALFHVDPSLYVLESLGEEAVLVTARFARSCPAVRYRIDRVRLVEAGCAEEPTAWRLAWR